MNFEKKKEDVLVFKKDGETFNILMDKENGLAIVYNKETLFKFKIDKENPLESVVKKIKEEQGFDMHGVLKAQVAEKIVDTERTTKKIIEYMEKSEVYQVHEFKLSRKELEDEMNEYGIVTKTLLRKIWNDLMQVYISDELIEDFHMLERQGVLEELIVYESDEETELEVEKKCNLLGVEEEEEYNQNLEKIKEMIMKDELVRREYDDDFYYDAYFKMSNYGIEELEDEDENDCVILQIRENFEFAQFVNPDIETKELTIKEFIEVLEKLRTLSKLLEI